MNKENFCKKLEKAVSDNLGAALSEKQKEQMFFLADKLVETNKVMNLTAIVDEDGIIMRHLVDSLLISGEIPQGARVIDVGCGGGFPTLPLAVFRPDITILAIDSTEKKIRYVQGVADELSLVNVRALAARAEELALLPDYRESFDVATARAVAALPLLCEITLPFVKVGGSLVAMKAKDARAELDASQNAIATLCGRAALSELTFTERSLDGLGISESRAIINVRKTSKTPASYPRKYAQIKKSPL